MSLLLLSILPVIFILLYVYSLDNHDREPKKLLLKMFFLGAIGSVAITSIIYSTSNYLVRFASYNIFDQFIKAFFLVGLTEEFSKYIIVKKFAQSHKEFNERFDGIVYAVFVSMGFAATENIFYVLDDPSNVLSIIIEIYLIR